MTRKRYVEAQFGRRPEVGDRVEILVAEEPFQRGDRGIVERVGTLVVAIRVERDPTCLLTMYGMNLKDRLLIID
jgi:hypothetical protein